MSTGRHFVRAIVLALAILTTDCWIGGTTRAFGQWCSSCPPDPCYTIYTAADGPEALQVHVVGERYDTIEAYFKNELFYRETLPDSLNLHCRNNVVLASANPYGTFAVRFGEYRDSFRIYGWKKDQEKPVVKEMTLEPGYPVRLCWVTTRILKVRYGPCQAKEYIVRFNDADTAWTELFKSP